MHAEADGLERCMHMIKRKAGASKVHTHLYLKAWKMVIPFSVQHAPGLQPGVPQRVRWMRVQARPVRPP